MKIDEIEFLNERYMQYYHKSCFPMMYQYKLHGARELLKECISVEHDGYAYDLKECFLPPLNNKNSLTNAIRSKEQNSYFESEQKIEPCNTKIAIDIWKDKCIDLLGNKICNVTCEDIGVKVDRNKSSDQVISVLNCRKSDVGKDIIPVFQLFCLVEENAKNLDSIIADLVDAMHFNGYNLSEVKKKLLKKQPFNDIKLILLMLTFEAIYCT